MVIALTAVGAIASPAMSQSTSARPPKNVLDSTITLTLRDVPVEDAVLSITRQPGVDVDYDAGHLWQFNRRVTLVARHMTIRDALAIALRGTDMHAIAYDAHTIVLKYPAPPPARSHRQ